MLHGIAWVGMNSEQLAVSFRSISLDAVNMWDENNQEANEMDKAAVHQTKPFFVDKGPLQQIVQEQNERMGITADLLASPERAQALTAGALRRSGLRPEDNIGSCSVIAAREGE